MEQLGRAGRTRRSAYAALRSAFDDAVTDGLLAASPVLRVKRPRATHQEAISLTPEQVAQFVHGARDLRYVRILRLILGTGLRRGEALALRWADIRLDRCELSIKGSLTRRGSDLLVSDAKTQRSRRVVSLSPAMVRLITEQRAEQVAERLRPATCGRTPASSLPPSSGVRSTHGTCCGRRRSPRNVRGCHRSACTPTPRQRC